MPAFFVRLCVFSTHPYFEKIGLSLFGVGEWVGGVVVLVG